MDHMSPYTCATPTAARRRQRHDAGAVPPFSSVGDFARGSVSRVLLHGPVPFFDVEFPGFFRQQSRNPVHDRVTATCIRVGTDEQIVVHHQTHSTLRTGKNVANFLVIKWHSINPPGFPITCETEQPDPAARLSPTSLNATGFRIRCRMLSVCCTMAAS